LTKKFTSLLLVALLIASTFAISVVSASAATTGSQVYFDNSAYNWDKVYVYAYGTKENAKWPGELMELDSSGLYTKSFASTYKSESIIFTNGLEKDEGKEQYPESAGLSLKTGECKLLTADLQWVDYGKPDDHGYAIAYTASGTSFSSDSIDVTLGLKNAEVGYYSIDGSSKTEFTEGKVITLGEGKVGNSTITLELSATGSDGVETTQTFTYKKVFTASQTTFSAASDGHTTEPETGYYGTNPNMQLGKYKTITVDGDVSDWDSSMIIAQGVANDDPRVYMPSSMHEQPWDAYALYSAWDDDNLYFMMELANTTYIISPSDDFAASNEARPWRNSIPMYLALSIDPDKQSTGKAIGTNKDGSTYTNPFVWGCTGGVAKDGGTAFTTHIDTLVTFDSNNSNGGDSIYKADVLDTDGTYLFDYDTRVPIGVTSWEKQDNQNGFQIKYANGTKSSTLFGINASKGSRVLGDNTDSGSNWVDFFDLGYKASYGYVYEIAIPLSTLGIDREYIETKGIGAMEILTYGTSGMDCLPHDPSMLDNANVEYSYDPSTSHEKEDVDDITVPLARIGALLDDTVVNEAPFEVNFGADRNSGQDAGTAINLVAESYNGSDSVEYEFLVNGTSVQKSSSSTYVWIPTTSGKYKLTVNATDSNGKTATSTISYRIGQTDDEPSIYELGDVNLDGTLTIADVTEIQKYLAELTDFSDEQLALADVNNDSTISIVDATSIQKILAGLEI
jgi:alpha-amylase